MNLKLGEILLWHNRCYSIKLFDINYTGNEDYYGVIDLNNRDYEDTRPHFFKLSAAGKHL